MIKKRVLYNGEMENEAFRFECRSCGQVYNDPPNEQQCPYCSGWLITDTTREQRLRALPMKSKEEIQAKLDDLLRIRAKNQELKDSLPSDDIRRGLLLTINGQLSTQISMLNWVLTGKYFSR